MVNYDMDEIERRADQYEVERNRDSDWVSGLSERYPDLIVLEPRSLFNPCIIGVVQRINLECLCYDTSKIIIALMRDMKIDQFEAWEYYGYNIEGSFIGEHSPVFLTHKMGDQNYV